MELQSKACVPCQGGIPPLTLLEAKVFLEETPLWSLSEKGNRLRRSFNFKDFVEALEFVNKVGLLAEQEAHHPDISMGWGYVDIQIFTHKIDGLHENDFILAAKIDTLK
ncbi:MAG: 4a-hydroxytetrahydrobiopterin dehydratase [Rhodospirillaceae bacterium]|jgi:4a-hydroxytetrahydrobiopterin dehydratase